MPARPDPLDPRYQIIDLLPPKLWLCGGGCSVTERISKRYGLIKDPPGADFYDPERSARTALAVNGAVIRGTTIATSYFDTVDTSATAIGWERHNYEVFVPRGCRLKRCTISVICAAQGGFDGTVSGGDDTSASGVANLNVCGTNFPVELDIVPNPAPSDAETEIVAHGTAQTAGASGDITYKYKAKKVVGRADGEHIPSVSVPSDHGCQQGTIELEAQTTVTLGAHSSSWITRKAQMTANLENTIRTIKVTCECDCPEAGAVPKSPQTPGEPKQPGGGAPGQGEKPAKSDSPGASKAPGTTPHDCGDEFSVVVRASGKTPLEADEKASQEADRQAKALCPSRCPAVRLRWISTPSGTEPNCVCTGEARYRCG